jgi:hypothetical protein
MAILTAPNKEPIESRRKARYSCSETVDNITSLAHFSDVKTSKKPQRQNELNKKRLEEYAPSSRLAHPPPTPLANPSQKPPI